MKNVKLVIPNPHDYPILLITDIESATDHVHNKVLNPGSVLECEFVIPSDMAPRVFSYVTGGVDKMLISCHVAS